MLSISVPMKGAGRGEYYLRLAQEDYYFNKGEPMGEWYGRGAERLGLSGRIEPDHLRRLLDGHSPDGKKDLVQIQNTRDRSRQSAWDLTFSAPKSLSVLWAVATDRVRRELEAAQREALHAGLAFLQERAGVTRRGKEGRIHEPADLIFATFRHCTSREQDPHLHFHALVINTCVRQDGSTGAIWSKKFFDLKMEAGAVFCQALAAAIHRRLGLTVEWEPDGFHITGVPRELCDIFSKRRAQIKAYLAAHNESGAIAAKKAALSTRRKKADVNRQELFAAWRQTSDQFGWSTAHAKELVRKAEAQLAETKAGEQRTEADTGLKPRQANRTPVPEMPGMRFKSRLVNVERRPRKEAGKTGNPAGKSNNVEPRAASGARSSNATAHRRNPVPRRRTPLNGTAADTGSGGPT
jgi:conjugative relaxase-like TrwC/TraI family protein